MSWVLQSPQVLSIFGNLGYVQPDGYHINENCNAALETILHNILSEDKYLRTYRRSINFGQNVQKDLIPLLIHAKEVKTIDLLIRILVNLTIPIECLLSTDIIFKTDFGRHTIFEMNNLLTSTKAAFTDHRTTRVIIDFLKKNMEIESKSKLSLEQCANISNSLLLLRNILHIPDDSGGQSPTYTGPVHAMQNQILWNIFSQSVDKILIRLMVIPDTTNWGVTMVQLIALLYKDQHVVTLHKLLNLWLEASLSESSEDNESNTSPPDRGREDSSPMLTSDPTSDSSDTGGSGKSNDESNVNSVNNDWNGPPKYGENKNDNNIFQPPLPRIDKNHKKIKKMSNYTESTKNDTIVGLIMEDNKSSSSVEQKKNEQDTPNVGKNPKTSVISENSDCGYGTQIENQESISTSSNDDELPAKKPVHQKPHNPKQRVNNKGRTGNTIQDRKKRKFVKRGKSNIMNSQGFFHKTPTDDDISNILKEFTVNFLLKGYNSLVQTLYRQILTNLQLQIDTSHFFWLVTYFLRFATQIELDLEHVSSVLSFDIISYLTAEGVNLCEQFELAVKLDGNDLKPSIRRLHLVVTSIREFVQAIEVYKKLTHLCKNDQDALMQLQFKMCETDELRSLLVLLLRHYNPKHHSKQYLQDLIVTNHILLTFLDSVRKIPEYKGTPNMADHLKQFASTEMMYKYSLLLEDYAVNGEFVNDCVFTIMHHVGGDLGSLVTLFQPKILKAFTSIWKTDFEVCDDWLDLIEYVINTFVKKTRSLQNTSDFRFKLEGFNYTKELLETPHAAENGDRDHESKRKFYGGSSSSKDRWTEDELSALSWNYMQCKSLPDPVGELIKMFKDDGIIKTRYSIIKELCKQNFISKEQFDEYKKCENEDDPKDEFNNQFRDDEISKLCEQLTLDGKLKFLEWVQKVLLDTCCSKIYIEKSSQMDKVENVSEKGFKTRENDFALISPVSYHSILSNESVPLVPWNCEQALTCKDLKFLQLLHRLGFHMPVDSGKVFIRIPHFWNAEFMYEVAGKILPINKSKLKFSINDIALSSVSHTIQQNSIILPKDIKDVTAIETHENFYQVHKQNHHATMVNFTPMPESSFDTDLHSESNKLNWFELVKKAQEYKITLHLNGGMKSEPVAGPSREKDLISPLGIPPLSSNLTDNQLDDAANFDIPLVETENCNNSVCETASVASNLTRMYVSDEDEKPKVLIRPVIKINSTLDDLSMDLESGTSAGKRARVQKDHTF